MLKVAVFSLGAVLVFQLFNSAFGLECYSCMATMNTNNECEVDLTNVLYLNCTPGFVCTTIVTKADNVSTIHRLCGQSNECEVVRASNSHMLDIQDRAIEHCYSCNSTLCNSAESIATFGLLFSQCIVLLLIKLFV